MKVDFRVDFRRVFWRVFRVAFRVAFRRVFWRVFRVAFWVPFWMPSPEGSFLEANRTGGACSAHRISVPYPRSLFFTPNASENASRTPGSLFEHGTHIRYHSRPSPVPNATTAERRRALRHRISQTARKEKTISEKRVAVASEMPVHPRSRGKEPPETSSALAGRRK